MAAKKKGLALLIVLVVILILILVGFAILTQSEQESILGRIDSDKNKAFYLAEAGPAKMQERLQNPIVGELSEVLEGTLGGGSYRVEIDTSSHKMVTVGLELAQGYCTAKMTSTTLMRNFGS
jgi:Tfp pilus assembly protein PilX